uniref:ATP-dependent DNA helicase 2 subunit 1 n=2 Tax=Caenorhabditis japonica TaxID=281687 RepID=A0A8R1EB92_CAEJA
MKMFTSWYNVVISGGYHTIFIIGAKISGFYRALLDRCWARQQAVICRYQSRSKQKMRIVALIPFKKDLTLIEDPTSADDETMEDKKPDLLRLEQQRAQADSSEWLHEGFMLIGLPFREELRDDFKRFEEHQTAGGTPELEQSQVEAMKKFVKRLTMSYNPSFYENPRLLSERSALCVEATGEELIERKDTLEPYYQIPTRLQRVGSEIEQIIEKFGLTDEDKKSEPKGRKRKPVDAPDNQPEAKMMSIRDCVAAEKMSDFKKDELLNMAVEHCEAPKGLKSKTKNDIISVIKEFLADHPSSTWDVNPKK